MANVAVFLLKALCIIISTPQFVVQGLESSWAYRGFNVKCTKGTRLTGGTRLEVLHQVQSKLKCLGSCFGHEDCQFVNYSPKTRECLLQTGSAHGTVEDEDYLSCGPDINEVWDRTPITIELPTTTPLPTTQEPNECDSSPCQHGQCTDGWEMFTCTCTPGYSGTTCDININECSSSPCVHGACSDGVNQYTCSCNAGYGGTRCNININECANNPCVNGACYDGVNRYTCSCNAGYTGTRCDRSGSIRLVGGSLPNEGRVEVYYSGVWGTVCDDLWDISDGNVACRELGYPSAQYVWGSAAFGQGSGSIHLHDLGCSGSESSLGSCSHSGWGIHNCVHDEDAGVRCNVY